MTSSPLTLSDQRARLARVMAKPVIRRRSRWGRIRKMPGLFVSHYRVLRNGGIPLFQSMSLALAWTEMILRYEPKQYPRSVEHVVSRASHQEDGWGGGKPGATCSREQETV